MKSALSGAQERAGSTTSQQPVFQIHSRRQVDLDAVVVRLDHAYVYEVRDLNLGQNWTHWQAATSQAPADSAVHQRLARGESIDRSPPLTTAPKARYKVLRSIEYQQLRQRQRIGAAEDIPPC